MNAHLLCYQGAMSFKAPTNRWDFYFWSENRYHEWINKVQLFWGDQIDSTSWIHIDCNSKQDYSVFFQMLIQSWWPSNYMRTSLKSHLIVLVSFLLIDALFRAPRYFIYRQWITHFENILWKQYTWHTVYFLCSLNHIADCVAFLSMNNISSCNIWNISCLLHV